MDARDVQVSVAAEVALAYVDLRAFQRRLALARTNVQLQEETLGLVRARFDAGLVGERDVAQALTNLESTRSRVPDLCLYTWARIPRTPDGIIADDFVTPPDIAVEVMSPGQTIRAMNERCRWYVANGVQIALLVNHFRGSVTRFTADGETVLTGADRIDLDAVLPGFELTVQALFAVLQVD